MADNIPTFSSIRETKDIRYRDIAGIMYPVHMFANSAGTLIDPIAAVAHDAVDSGEPIKIGFRAAAGLSTITLVAAADRTDAISGLDGAQIVRPHCGLEDIVAERVTNIDGASTAFTVGLAAPGAGLRLNIKKVTISNTSASMVTVDLRDGVAGAVLWTIPVSATGGGVENFDIPLRLTANTALAFDASAATTTLTIAVSAFKSKV